MNPERALETLGTVSAGVPLAPNPLLGRARELAHALRLLRSPSVRLLTLSGPPGVGKTRLAIEIARELRDERSAVHFVDLSQVRDAAQVPGELRASLWSDLLPVDAVVAQRPADPGEQVLFVLDTFEHVRPAAEWLADVLATVPNVQFLVTSRVRLRLRWERVLVLQPLAVPSDPAHAPTKRLARSPSVALYVGRAKMADPAFRLTSENAEGVASFAARVEGVPLALELAASQVNVLPPQELSSRLESQRLLELDGNWGDGPQRHQSLGASLDWSYQLLDAADQVIFRQLSVFEGDWSLEAAAAVCGQQLAETEMLAALSRLVDSNLVHVTRDSHRFSMLDITREFALQRLEAAGDTRATRAAQAAWYAGLACEAAAHLHDRDQRVWLRVMDEESPNCLTALAWSLEDGSPDHAEQLAASLGAYWCANGNYARAQHWLTRAAQQGACTVRVLELAGLAAAWLGDAEAAWQHLSRALELAVRSENQLEHACVMASHAAAAWALGGSERARAWSEQTDHARALGDTSARHYAAWAGGMLLLEVGQLERAAALLTESLQLCEAADDAAGIARAHLSLASLALRQGRPDEAAVLTAEAMSCLRHVDLAPLNAWTAVLVLLLGGDDAPRDALMRVRAGLEASRIDDLLPLPPVLRSAFEAARPKLPEARGTDAATRKDVPTLEDFIEVCLGSLTHVGAHSAWPQQKRGDNEFLSPRERHVIHLVAEGATNKEIAATLVVAEATARFHVASLLSKLGATNRTQAVTIARRRGLL
jgi:predicted ATPase/DNA-binding CsgD family transcriptional regulator